MSCEVPIKSVYHVACDSLCGMCGLKSANLYFQTIAEREALEREQEELAAKEKSRLVERKV